MAAIAAPTDDSAHMLEELVACVLVTDHLDLDDGPLVSLIPCRNLNRTHQTCSIYRCRGEGKNKARSSS